MSIAAIIALVCGVIGALLGALITHPISKAEGKKEGAKDAFQEQEAVQAKAINESVQERSRVEKKTSATPGADLDSELSEFSRPD